MKQERTMALPTDSSLVLYHGKCAVVTAVGSEQIEIRTDGGKKSVRHKDVELLHHGPVSALPDILPDPKYEEMLALMEDETLSFSDFMELAYSRSDSAAAWSAYNLITCNLYFSGSLSTGVKAKPITEIDSALAAIAAKEASRNARNELIERIRSASVTDNDRVAMREIEQVALGNSENSRLMKDLEIDSTAENAQQLLVKTSLWDLFTNPWPARFGIALEDPEIEMPEIPEDERLDLTHMEAFAIDDSDSHDPDDAVSFHDGLLWIHVADPASVAHPGGEIDSEAVQRGENLYLPELISHMLPTSMTGKFGLGLNQESPAISFALKITEEGDAVIQKMTLSRVRVRRLNYDEASALMEESPLSEINAMLELFRKRRIASGALLINLPEVKLRVKDRNISVMPIELLPVRELVANAMIAAGAAVGKWAVENDIPMPFAVQPEADVAANTAETLASMFAMRRACSPGSVQILPGRHAGLGLDPYVRITSPLRRYVDLLAHQQIRRFLKGEELLSSDHIDGRIAVSEKNAAERRKLERQVNEYWKLVYLSQNPGWNGEAFLVYRQDDRLTFLIPSLAYEYRTRLNCGIKLDDAVTLRLNYADPVHLNCRMQIL